MIIRNLEEAEEQYQMTIRSHLQNMDNLIDLQDSKLLVLENDFDSELRMLEDECIVNVVSSDPVPCGRCGEPAISHTKKLCQRCLITLENECSASMRALKERIGDEYRDNLQTIHEAVERKREKTANKANETSPAPAKTGKGMAIQERLTRKYGGR